MNVASYGECLRGAQNHFAEYVAIVHRIEEGKPGVEARSRQHRKKRPVRSVVRVAVPARFVEPRAEPWTRALHTFGLKTYFDRARTRFLCELSPLSTL